MKRSFFNHKMPEAKRIKIEDFQRLDLRIGKIISAQKISGSNKLLDLEIDLGEEKRKIVAGIGKNYQPGDLLGKEVVVLVNLEAKEIFGLKSDGMILAVEDKKGPIILVPERETVIGAKIK